MISKSRFANDLSYARYKLDLIACQALKPACEEALRRIFKLCDTNKDGVLDNEELNEFQVCSLPMAQAWLLKS